MHAAADGAGKDYRTTGLLAESVALDMDHKCKDHSKWYKAVKAACKLLAELDSQQKQP